MKRFLLALLVTCGPAQKVVQNEPRTAPIGVRFIVGGDSRQDVSHVLPWAIQEARVRKSSAFIFLGDMELTPGLDDHFLGEVDALGSIPFFPVVGNHEVRVFGCWNQPSLYARRT